MSSPKSEEDLSPIDADSSDDEKSDDDKDDEKKAVVSLKQRKLKKPKFKKKVYRQTYAEYWPPASESLKNITLPELIMNFAKKLWSKHNFVDFNDKYVIVNLPVVHLDLAKVLHTWLIETPYLSFDVNDEDIDDNDDDARSLYEVLSLGVSGGENEESDQISDIYETLKEWSRKDCWEFYKSHIRRNRLIPLVQPLVEIVLDYVNDPEQNEAVLESKKLKEEELKRKGIVKRKKGAMPHKRKSTDSGDE